MKNTLIILLFFLTKFLYSQVVPKEINAIRVAEGPIINGKLDDSVWEKAERTLFI